LSYIILFKLYNKLYIIYSKVNKLKYKIVSAY